MAKLDVSEFEKELDKLVGRTVKAATDKTKEIVPGLVDERVKEGFGKQEGLLRRIQWIVIACACLLVGLAVVVIGCLGGEGKGADALVAAAPPAPAVFPPAPDPVVDPKRTLKVEIPDGAAGRLEVRHDGADTIHVDIKPSKELVDIKEGVKKIGGEVLKLVGRVGALEARLPKPGPPEPPTTPMVAPEPPSKPLEEARAIAAWINSGEVVYLKEVWVKTDALLTEVRDEATALAVVAIVSEAVDEYIRTHNLPQDVTIEAQKAPAGEGYRALVAWGGLDARAMRLWYLAHMRPIVVPTEVRWDNSISSSPGSAGVSGWRGGSWISGGSHRAHSRGSLKLQVLE